MLHIAEKCSWHRKQRALQWAGKCKCFHYTEKRFGWFLGMCSLGRKAFFQGLVPEQCLCCWTDVKNLNGKQIMRRIPGLCDPRKEKCIGKKYTLLLEPTSGRFRYTASSGAGWRPSGEGFYNSKGNSGGRMYHYEILQVKLAEICDLPEVKGINTSFSLVGANCWFWACSYWLPQWQVLLPRSNKYVLFNVDTLLCLPKASYKLEQIFPNT